MPARERIVAVTANGHDATVLVLDRETAHRFAEMAGAEMGLGHGVLRRVRGVLDERAS